MNTNTIGRSLKRVGSMLSSNRSNSTRNDRTGRTGRSPRGRTNTGTRSSGGGLKSMARRFLNR